MPLYNGKKYLKDSIESILSQTVQTEVELVIVDDGSTDGSAELARQLAPNASIFSQKNQGAAAARTHAMQKAQGEYLFFQDCDDVSLPKRLQTSLAMFQADADVGLVFGGAEYIDDEGQPTRNEKGEATYSPPAFSLEELFQRNSIMTGSVGIRRSVFNKVGGMNPRLHYMEDWEYWLRAACVTKLKRIETILYQYRLRDSGITATLETGQTELSKRAFSRSALGLLWSAPGLSFAFKARMTGQIFRKYLGRVRRTGRF